MSEEKLDKSLEENQEEKLPGILVDVCRELEKYPYATIDYEMLKECIYPYTNIKQINQERMRILMHLNAIKSDCDALAMDVEKTLKELFKKV